MKPKSDNVKIAILLLVCINAVGDSGYPPIQYLILQLDGTNVIGPPGRGSGRQVEIGPKIRGNVRRSDLGAPMRDMYI
jgi:hypothetical protein